ncbi:MAG: hypothetical protein ABSE73_16260, partial [Planctomycetota bacterium]
MFVAGIIRGTAPLPAQRSRCGGLEVPPHVGPQGRDKSCKRFDVDFGATVPCGKEHDWNLSYLYPPFLEQAKRV